MAMPTKRHCWESDQPASSHAWEQGEADSDMEGEDPADPHTDKDAAAAEFVDMLVGMYMLSQISAQDLCVACYWAHKAGMPGVAKLYAMRPGASSGNYQRHLDIAMGFGDVKSTFYQVRTVGHPKGDVRRQELTLAMLPVHELLDDEMSETTGARTQLEEAIIAEKLPPIYWQNPIVQASEEKSVMPLALFLDGVAYSNSDSVVGIFAMNLITGRRWLLGAVRKRLTCRCGCRGWDTWWDVMSFLHWSLTATGQGLYPDRRHDGGVLDPRRQALAGKQMKFKGAVIQLRGDWAEFCERFGYPTCSHLYRPCFCCAGNRENMYNPVGLSLRSTPWHVNSDSDYDIACAACEIWIDLTAETHAMVKAALFYDKRGHGNKGRCLAYDVAPLNLKAGDRLEVWEGLRDVNGLDVWTDLPQKAPF